MIIKLCQVTRYERNPLGKITKVTDPLGRTESFTYNKRGELISKLDLNDPPKMVHRSTLRNYIVAQMNSEFYYVRNAISVNAYDQLIVNNILNEFIVDAIILKEWFTRIIDDKVIRRGD